MVPNLNTTSPTQYRGTCFVVMGFGKKTDFETGRTLDLDKPYYNMIKPAVEAAGLTCIRADEIVHSGMIDVPMYEQLLKADVVIADLSTSNKNAFYELGVRHALKPYTTIVIAEDGIKAFPFDVNRVLIRQYHHLGEDIGFSEVIRFQKLLTGAIQEILNKEPRDKDSPIYTVLENLTPPDLAKAVQRAIANATKSTDSSASDQTDASAATHSVLMQQVDAAQQRGDFVTAKALLATVRAMMRSSNSSDQPQPLEDPYIIQRLALLTYKSESPTKEQALHEALDLLTTLNPQTSNDTETLGLLGAVNKRLYEQTGEVAYLSQAIRAYRRGFNLRNDYYNGINLAYLFNVRAAKTTNRAEAIADFIQAQRYRQEVLEVCEQWLQENPPPADDNAKALADYQKNLYWILATKAEAYIGIGKTETGEEYLKQAYAVVSPSWMRESTEEQLKKLNLLIADSPLKYVLE